MNHLSISWSTSKGRDSYGYNICRLDSANTGKRYKTCGGGYDMLGTVFGQWLMSEHMAELKTLVSGFELEDCDYVVKGFKRPKNGFYGLTIRPDGSISLDGGCGLSCVQTIGDALGFSFKWLGNRKGHTVGYIVTKKGE